MRVSRWISNHPHPHPHLFRSTSCPSLIEHQPFSQVTNSLLLFDDPIVTIKCPSPFNPPNTITNISLSQQSAHSVDQMSLSSIHSINPFLFIPDACPRDSSGYDFKVVNSPNQCPSLQASGFTHHPTQPSYHSHSYHSSLCSQCGGMVPNNKR